MQNGKVFLICIFCAFYFLAFSDRNYSQSPDFPKDDTTTIAEVKFKGLDNFQSANKHKIENPINESDFLYLLRTNQVQLFDNAKYKSEQVEKALKLIKEGLYNRSYLDAKVTAFGEMLADNQIRLVFSIERGTLIPVSEINFIGNHNVAAAELVKTMKDCLKGSWKTFYKRYYEYCSQKNVRDLLSGKGYFNARTSFENRRISDNMVVTIKIEEGARYRIGNIQIEGLTIFSEKQFLEILGQKQGDIVDGKNLREFLYDKLTRLYANRGYMNYDAEPEIEYINPQIEGQDSTVNLKFIVDEGKQFKIGRLSIVSDELSKIPKIRTLLGLVEGETFNQEKFENGIKRINDTKEFRFIDKDKDVKMRTGDGTADINLAIIVNKK